MAKNIEIYGKDAEGTHRVIRTNADGAPVVGGDVAHDAVDSGNPQKVGGIGRTTNPTAVADGDRVNASYDKLGRALTMPYQVRDLVRTGYAQLGRYTEATIISAVAGAYLDLISITACNTSSLAVKILVRDVAGGNAVMRLVIPANNTFRQEFNVPLPQGNRGNALTAIVDGTGDESDSPIVVAMRAIQNI